MDGDLEVLAFPPIKELEARRWFADWRWLLVLLFLACAIGTIAYIVLEAPGDEVTDGHWVAHSSPVGSAASPQPSWFAALLGRVEFMTGVSNPAFPSAATTLEGLKLFANYRLRENLTLTGSYRFEHYDAADWQLDGVLPGTVPNLLTLGELPPHYNVQIVRVALRYRF